MIKTNSRNLSWNLWRPDRHGLHKALSKTAIYTTLCITGFLTIFPFLWMISASLKTEMAIFDFPIRWIPQNPQWVNFLGIWKKINLARYYYNTVYIAVLTTALQLATSSMAAYAFAKIRFPERNTIFLAYLATLMVPFQVVMVPQFLVVSWLNLTNTHLALILIHGFSPFGVFMLRQFYLGVPDELLEAARIDGLNEWGIFTRIMAPLSKPALASLGVLTFVTIWNDFLTPLVYISSDHLRTIQLGVRLFVTAWSVDYASIMAVAVVALLPLFILFIFVQRYLVEGIMMSGIKG